ncbi:hypothetical protein [Microlunatus phosphovorus]|nr:hypothetical protein [Microlunatus phosphovorus]
MPRLTGFNAALIADLQLAGRVQVRRRLDAVLDHPTASGSALIRTVRNLRLATPTIPGNTWGVV